jgi:hypothetical protein
VKYRQICTGWQRIVQNHVLVEQIKNMDYNKYLLAFLRLHGYQRIDQNMHLWSVSIQLTYTNISKCWPTTNRVLSGSALGASFDPLIRRGVHCRWKGVTDSARYWHTLPDPEHPTVARELLRTRNSKHSITIPPVYLTIWIEKYQGICITLFCHSPQQGQNHGNLDTGQHGVLIASGGTRRIKMYRNMKMMTE